MRARVRPAISPGLCIGPLPTANSMKRWAFMTAGANAPTSSKTLPSGCDANARQQESDMTRSMFVAILASVAALFAAPGTSTAEEANPAMTTEAATLPMPEKSGLLPINGLNYYYVIHGKGEPLL